MNPATRSINWLEETSRSLEATFPALRASNCLYMTTRLSRTLMERLPPDIGIVLLELLPETLILNEIEFDALRVAANQLPDLSIGYPELVEIAERSLVEPIVLPSDPVLAENFFARVTDYFLWAIAQEFSPELKHRISENLPVDLRTRMNLYSGHVEQSKVA
jgi:hypothetical protein